MRRLTIGLESVGPELRMLVGGKALALSELIRLGHLVPRGLCITTEAYESYVRQTGLHEQIPMELGRKPLHEMRWEEIWDVSLRIRNAFLHRPLPDRLRRMLTRAIGPLLSRGAIVVRSSAPEEDSSARSFAGLHESYVNVTSLADALDRIRLVWSSLWSDAALMYRKELNLSVETSSMAVLIQEVVAGRSSGVAFSRDPGDASRSVVEAVHGLNQGLVDGSVQPDRWIFERRSGQILSHARPKREVFVAPGRSGVRIRRLGPRRADRRPLSDAEAHRVFRLARDVEGAFGVPQDVEWTWKGRRLVALQARPITTSSEARAGDRRAWHLSLRRSFENLCGLRQRIEHELLPAMDADARRMADVDLLPLSDGELLAEVTRRIALHTKWLDVYWSDFIPFAHGARLFGQFYNDAIRPSDPHEFTALLASVETISAKRNSALEQMAWRVREDGRMYGALCRAGTDDRDPELDEMVDAFLLDFAEGPLSALDPVEARAAVCRILLNLTSCPSLKSLKRPRDREAMERQFLSALQEPDRAFAAEMLDLAKASYRLRDDDNVYLGRIVHELNRARAEGRRRGLPVPKPRYSADVLRPTAREDYGTAHPSHQAAESPQAGFSVSPRQLIGQPASSGLADGKARTIRQAADLFQFEAGEVLVCDAVDPGMAFVLPIAGGIVERRGGMLVHGAIIAREYGVPCVTGVTDAVDRIPSGTHVTVDGYLGIVTVST